MVRPTSTKLTHCTVAEGMSLPLAITLYGFIYAATVLAAIPKSIFIDKPVFTTGLSFLKSEEGSGWKNSDDIIRFRDSSHAGTSVCPVRCFPLLIN